MKNKTLRNNIRKMTLSAMFLAITYIIPTLTQSIPSFNIWFSPMHFPVLLCGFIVGWKYGLIVGFLAPILRAYTIGMPFPVEAWPMAFELASYGFITGIMYQYLPKKWYYLYIDLVTAMIIGRTINILMKIVIYPLFSKSFVLLGAIDSIIKTWPAFILNIVLVPLIILALQRAKFIEGFEDKMIK